ncbi:MAG: DUF6145 family protein [Hespellia sp.]|nr:DUF6145 family protein [Hespellia sp.]
MEDDKIVLCAASAYERKYYLNPEFQSLPEKIQKELQILCVLYTEDVGGVIAFVFDEAGNLSIDISHEDNDLRFDEIGSGLKIKEMQQKNVELFQALEVFFRVFFLGQEV